MPWRPDAPHGRGEGAPHLGGRGGASQRATPSAWRRAGAPSARRCACALPIHVHTDGIPNTGPGCRVYAASSPLKGGARLVIDSRRRVCGARSVPYRRGRQSRRHAHSAGGAWRVHVRCPLVPRAAFGARGPVEKLRGARRPLTVRRDSGWSAGRTFSALTDTFFCRAPEGCCRGRHARCATG